MSAAESKYVTAYIAGTIVEEKVDKPNLSQIRTVTGLTGDQIYNVYETLTTHRDSDPTIKDRGKYLAKFYEDVMEVWRNSIFNNKIDGLTDEIRAVIVLARIATETTMPKYFANLDYYRNDNDNGNYCELDIYYNKEFRDNEDPDIIEFFDCFPTDVDVIKKFTTQEKIKGDPGTVFEDLAGAWVSWRLNDPPTYYEIIDTDTILTTISKETNGKLDGFPWSTEVVLTGSMFTHVFDNSVPLQPGSDVDIVICGRTVENQIENYREILTWFKDKRGILDSDSRRRPNALHS